MAVHRPYSEYIIFILYLAALKLHHLYKPTVYRIVGEVAGEFVWLMLILLLLKQKFFLQAV
ncbi:hypothetical protein D770_00850 [Flammeovirgaceae bacterium 311]|nr:hypothetical protein D770_00850 [Flammeovirgaceae bacterium 311]